MQYNIPLVAISWAVWSQSLCMVFLLGSSISFLPCAAEKFVHIYIDVRILFNPWHVREHYKSRKLTTEAPASIVISVMMLGNLRLGSYMRPER